MRLAALPVVLLLALVSAPAPALAWGDTAHEIICEIAFQEMSRPARDEVKRLIRLDPEFSMFNESCTWPDHPRKRAPEHFINLARNATMISGTACPLPGVEKCLLTAIAADVTVLGGPGATDEQRIAALKFLGHWLGDVHQPLHVSFQDDRGGNEIRATGGCPQDNLHAVWDTCLVVDGIGGSVKSIADQLRAGLTNEQRSEWAGWQTFTPELVTAWANESFAITRSPSVGYCTQKQGACWYAPNNKVLAENEVRRSIDVDEAYLEAHAPTVKQRLLQAGVRLGRLIDDLLAHP